MIDLNESYRKQQEKELLKEQGKDILSSIIGVLITYLIWRYWSHTAAVLIFVYSSYRNHGYTQIMLRRILNKNFTQR